MHKTTKAPPTRVADRPDPASWGEDELMTLPEAAALFWPRGPLSAGSLRVAIRDGRLSVAVIAGRHLVTRRAIGQMSQCAPLQQARPSHRD